MVCFIVCILIFRSLGFKLVLFVVVVVAALFVFGRLHFDLVLCFMSNNSSLFVLSLRRDLNKNSSKPCFYLGHVLEKTRLK